MGGLTQNVEMYLKFNSGSEVLYTTVNRADMYDGPVGLPRFDISLSLTQALSALGVSSFSGNDVVTVRFVLNLTDGRSFSRTNVTGSMTGSYFRSPYQYPIVIGCRFDETILVLYLVFTQLQVRTVGEMVGMVLRSSGQLMV